MALISLKDVTYSYGGPTLLDSINFQIEAGERIGLLGRNGAGKSTLMKLVSREIEPDSGEVIYQQNVTASRLIQEVPPGEEGNCLHIVLSGLGKLGSLLDEYQGLLDKMPASQTDVNMDRLDKLQHEIESNDGWNVNIKAESILTQMGIEPKAEFNSLSGGMKRRVLLAKALVSEPQVLLLDEPTNHLDIHSIRWMENFLLGYPATLVFVTHDRAFLKKLSTRIAEVDRGQVISWQCGYRDFLIRRDEVYEAELKNNAVFDKKLTQEEAWIRRGVKARRARNEGRVRALIAMRKERAARREKQGDVKMNIADANKSGRQVSVARNISFSYGDKKIISNYSFDIIRGDRIGFVGANGSGKTTLLKLLLGQLKPQTGSVVLGTQLELTYFDQLRDTLDPSKTVLENLGIGGDYFDWEGKRKHVMGYLQDFLFSPQQIRNPVSYLSGGEKNRLLLARLFIKPSNVMVLDEPTNDLDIETLELLEEILGEYKGTVILVSHDREFVNNLTTTTLAMEGDGSVKEYADGYESWIKEWDKKQSAEPKKKTESPPKTTQVTKNEKVKLSYKEKELLKNLPGKIEQLEKRQSELEALMAGADFYEKSLAEQKKVQDEFATLAQELDSAYANWEELDSKA